MLLRLFKTPWEPWIYIYRNSNRVQGLLFKYLKKILEDKRFCIKILKETYFNLFVGIYLAVRFKIFFQSRLLTWVFQKATAWFGNNVFLK